MFWSEVIMCMLEAVTSLVEFVVATQEHQSPRPQPSLRTDSDHWKCPGAAEIATFVNGAARSADHASGASNDGKRDLR
jgi:hypothetical protein